MFRNRRNTQKPDEELYASFRQNFPNVGPSTASAVQGTDPGPLRRSSTLSEAIVDDPSEPQRSYDAQADVKDPDATPKPFTDSWRFTPSLMDPNSFAFSAFANQPPGYYTPTPGGFGTLYHPQAGDLHTPGMGMNTPLSLPHSIHGLHAHDSIMQLQHFNPHFLHNPHPFQDVFSQQHPVHSMAQHQPQTYAPQQFLQHQDSGYVAMDDSPHKTTPLPGELGVVPSSMAQPIPTAMSTHVGVGLQTPTPKFRFQTTLNAPTAMVRHADEIPITYLNKGQAYTMSIFDTTPPIPQPGQILKYRTYVRVSFEDEQQRARPGACWQLWKEGRGTNEAHQRGGKLLAVEYVDPNQGGDDDLRKSQIQLEKASFDGFAVTWFPASVHGAPDSSISVRFNFLSTDFSHSKGVKGIPVRLCAKTELISLDGTTTNGEPEVCFSKVKLFRDHGAERKLSNDVAHVKKTIDKLKQQIAQAEAGLGNAGKRRRSGSMVKASGSRPGKIVKHKRTWSVDSEGEGGKFTAEEDLQMKLVSMQDMFTSTQPISVLFLKGDPEDDPDLYPVKLPGDDPEGKELVRSTTWESRQSASDSPTSNAASPSASSTSPNTPKRRFSEMQNSVIQEEPESELDVDSSANVSSAQTRPVKIPKSEVESKTDLFAVDVDSSYKPPSDRPIRPVACFYVRQKDSQREYYRAVYLMQRTVKDLINGIAQKFEVDPHRVTQVTHVNSRGLRILVDEEVVRELPEGQDMMVEFTPASGEQPLKQELIAPASTEVMVDAEIPPSNIIVSDGLEMWLNY
ncbi:hypothetical protein PV10_00580 [Exophiala mesophila]|uniref:Grh/CP2 DB domain-containing protein n=1 Tax=Exophiala mesophila TaxID=212818 RepID=A0A0D1ZS26_EXOME|nr:uncharacterized protein PV10_00580 [Exophiala mesophila]KIV96759.1 hypothetical protein PV10_00580 [Exophiala mesophila]